MSFDKGVEKLMALPGYLPILRAGNIGQQLELFDDLIYVPDYNVSAEQRLRVDDIIICMSSASPSVVGKTARLKETFEGSVGAFCGIIRLQGIATASYIAQWFRSPEFVAWRDQQARGANIQNLRFSQLVGHAAFNWN